jgi:uncharacterized membrane protein/mono/diheme cytochrome c family protein
MSRLQTFWRSYRRLIAVGALLVTALVAYAIDWSQPPRLILFLGSLHPVVVHFPVALLLLAALLEGLARYHDRFAFVKPTISIVLALGALGAAASAGAGWFLSLTGGYEGGLVSWHQWLGIGVAVGGAGAWWLERAARKAPPSVPFAEAGYVAVLSVTVVLLVVTGHLGGSLTHGSGFLTQHLPAPIQRVLGGPGAAPRSGALVPIDSALVYQDLVHPILQTRCVECHGPNKAKGELRLDGPAHIRAGGEGGAVFQPGDPEQSELIRRVTLPLYHDDVMPPDGHPPLSVEHVELLRWWIAHEASFETKVADIEEETTPTSVQTVLARLARPRDEIRTGIYAEDVAPPDSSVLDDLARSPLRIRRVASGEPFLQVEVRSAVDTVDAALLNPLEGVAEQVAWLDLSGTVVTASALEVAGTFPHLTRLALRGATLDEAGLRALENNPFLAYLNLVESNVSDDGLRHLAAVNSLQALYLWQSRVTDAGVDSLKARIPRLDVNRGATLVVHDSTRTDTVRTVALGE